MTIHLDDHPLPTTTATSIALTRQSQARRKYVFQGICYLRVYPRMDTRMRR